jgi:hypothetical protein
LREINSKLKGEKIMTEELKGLPGWFSNHPMTKKIIAEDRAATDSKRKAALLEMTALETAFLTDRRKFEAEIEANGETLKAAVKALEEARGAYGTVHQKKMLLNVEFDRLYGSQRAILLASYPPVIDEFVHDMLNKLADLPKTFRHAKRAGAVHFFLDDEPELHESNAEAIQQASDYIRAAIAEAEAWKTADISEIDIVKRLEELRAGIPKTDIFETKEQVKPDISGLKTGGSPPRPKPRVEWFGGEWRPIGGWF